MKKISLFIAALFAAFAMNAQTIEIDGVNADWADVPMYTEPGVSPIVKFLVPQTGATLPDGAAYCMMVAGDHEKILAGYPVIYTDADNSALTGTSIWICPVMGVDYEMATWSDGSLFAANDAGSIREICIKNSAFSSLPFTGSFGAYLTFAWGELYIPTDPSTAGWMWSENTYHPFYVKPYTFANLNGTLTAADVFSTHEALSPGAGLNMKNAGSANDVLMWASWAVELTKPAVYGITADITSTNAASVDLKLVNIATNAVVASFDSEDLAAGSTVNVGQWDLSAVPAGKYVLKFSNHVKWSEMILNSITLTAQGSTAIDNANTAVKATKIVRDGQVLIQRDGKTFNAVGTEMK